MTKQFNVGDTVKYTSPCKDGQTVLGVVKKVDPSHFNYDAYKDTGYLVEWTDGDKGWISRGNLSLEIAGGVTISEAKELKVGFESEILRLIREFNKKTNLEVKDINLSRFKSIGGGCSYHLDINVEI